LQQETDEQQITEVDNPTFVVRSLLAAASLAGTAGAKICRYASSIDLSSGSAAAGKQTSSAKAAATRLRDVRVRFLILNSVRVSDGAPTPLQLILYRSFA
jgi:hypothetical protein